jgi:hypothetical protein
MLAGITSNLIRPAFLADLTFRSVTEYVWTGVGTLAWNGHSYRGIGSLGKLGGVSETSAVSAEGTSASLSGIDPALLGECMSDIQLGAPATIWFALFDQNLNVLGAPYPLFVGTIDQPSLQLSLDELAISLKLENKLVNLQRASNRRYTSADQQLYYPGDRAFNWIEILGDQALLWAP